MLTTQERQDQILDKINKYGIISLTINEKLFLDSWSNGKEDETNKNLNYKDIIIFEDESGLFRFEFQRTEIYKEEKHILGFIYVPCLVWEDGTEVSGRIEGHIIDYGSGKTSLNFSKKVKNPKTKKFLFLDIFEFCSGIEYELDIFIDYVINELKKVDFNN